LQQAQNGTSRVYWVFPSYAEQAARIARELGIAWAAALNLTYVAHGHTMAGDPQSGVDLATKALELARHAGSPTVIARCLVTLAGTLAATEPDHARRLLEEALAQRQRFDIDNLGDAWQATIVAARIGDWPLILQLADRSIRHVQWGGQRSWLAGVFTVVARALAPTDVEAAARLQGAARQMAVQIATRPITAAGSTSAGSPGVRPAGSSLFTDLRRQTSQLLHDALDEGQLRQLWAEGETMDSDQAATYALEAIRRTRQAQHPDGM
jgi:hypothetical protein